MALDVDIRVESGGGDGGYGGNGGGDACDGGSDHGDDSSECGCGFGT